MKHTNLSIRDENLHEQIIFADGKADFCNEIWGSKLIDCTLKSSASSRTLIFVDSTMQGGLFWQQGTLSGKSFDRVRFEGVKFKGKYKGVDFGGRLNNGNYAIEAGALEACDLTEAKLHFCRHFNGSFESNRYAEWPTVVIRGGQHYVVPETSNASPQDFHRLIKLFEQHSGGDYAVIFDADVIAKEDRIPADDLRAFLELNRTAVISGL